MCPGIVISDALVLGRVRRCWVAGVGIEACIFGQFSCREELDTVLLLPDVKVCYEMLKVLYLINAQFQHIHVSENELKRIILTGKRIHH